MENLEQKAKSHGKYELKEFIETKQVKEILQKWLNALENDQDLEIEVKGKSCKIPRDAFDKGKMKLEYEIKNGEYEFEMQLKWREEDRDLTQ